MNSSVMTRLLSLNAGFVDTVGFLGLQGLFTAHVTGNFVTLAAGFVYGPHGTIGKILALPEFIGAVAVARLGARPDRRCGGALLEVSRLRQRLRGRTA